jgi:hypothetical protein
VPLVLKMATPQRRSWYVLQSAKKECVTDISHTVLLNVAVKCETLIFLLLPCFDFNRFYLSCFDMRACISDPSAKRDFFSVFSASSLKFSVKTVLSPAT